MKTNWYHLLFNGVQSNIWSQRDNTHPNSWRTVLDHLFQASLFHLQSREHYCCSLTDVYQCLGFHCEMSNKSFETSNPSLSKSWKSCILLVASGFNVSICISVGVRIRFPTYVLPSWSETRDSCITTSVSWRSVVRIFGVNNICWMIPCIRLCFSRCRCKNGISKGCTPYLNLRLSEYMVLAS